MRPDSVARMDAEHDTVHEAQRDFFAATGVRLVTDVTGSDEPGREKAACEPELVVRAAPVLRDTLLIYPDSLRGGLIQEVHLFGVYKMGGKPFLGSARHVMRRVDLAVHPKTPLPQLQATLHHEIGHLVELRPAFPEARWIAISGAQAYTGKGHRDEWGKGSSEEMYALGFVTRYASKNHHEDFAELAELLFSTPARGRALAARHPRLAAKVELLEAQYRELMPELALPWR